MFPGAGAPMQKSELATYYFTALAVLLIFFIAQIIKTICDIVKKTPNETPQILNNLKTTIIIILLIEIVSLLPNEWGVTIWSAFLDAIK